MAESTNHCQSIDPATGFCSQTRTFHSLRPKVPLPPPYQPLSLPQYTLSLLRSSTATTGGDGDTTSNDVALILSPPSLHAPLLYFALMSLGIVISPANPLSSDSKIAHQVQLSKSIIAFATSTTSSKLLSLKHGTILLDSSEFISLFSEPNVDPNVINRVQGPDPPHPVSFFTVPLFYVFGFFMLASAFSMGETTIFTERFEFEGMLRAIEKYKVTYMPVSPPLVLALTKSDLTNKYDISSLLMLGSSGALLGKEVAERFKEKFPTVELVQ
ncbi:hypothetical protein Godav_016633, partial [Gossypium davidsonii]|nr:hypothetical protein [Gossypium davidsonii]